METPEPRGPGPDHLEPFAARVTLTAGAEGIAAPDRLVAGLITDIAERCQDAGSALIGHIKCHVRVGEARTGEPQAGEPRAGSGLSAQAFNCSLTSLRLGARCSGDVRPLEGDEALEVDLVVLVYGLSGPTVEEIVRAGCSGLAGVAGAVVRPSDG